MVANTFPKTSLYFYLLVVKNTESLHIYLSKIKISYGHFTQIYR
jgi:hypothetical protein